MKGVIEDLWQAISNHDKKRATMCLTGAYIDRFVKQELAHVTQRKITQYKCNFSKVAVDTVGKQWAWAVYDKTAVFADGTQSAAPTVSRLRRFQGQWLVLTGIKTEEQIRREQEEERQRLGDLLEDPIESQPGPINKPLIPASPETAQ